MDIGERLYTIRQISAMMPSVQTSLTNETARISTLLYDSRKLIDKAHGLFFALEGRRDGHRYIADAYRKGIRNFVVKPNKVHIADYPGANFIIVPDTLAAIQMLAARHRDRFSYPVIGITGSNGKTVVKEWLVQLLSPEYRIARSPKSYNSQIGVALSLWQLDATANLAIIEAGISQPGEMEALHQMIRPDIGILTNIGPAHDEGFSSVKEKINEKIKLFDGVKIAVYSPDYLGSIPLPHTGAQMTWGKKNARLHVRGHHILGDGQCRIDARYEGKDLEIVIPFTDAAAIENAVCCWATLLAMGYEPSVIGERMRLLQPVEMRLEMKKGINQCTVVDDSYSNDLSSLSIALDFLQQQRQHGRLTLILSDLPVSPEKEPQVYEKVSNLLENSRVSRLITIGPSLLKHAPGFEFLKHEAFPDTESFLKAFPTLSFQDEAILLKGARHFSFERISRLLTAKTHGTVLEINLNAVEYNLNQHKSLVSPSTKIMVMVKAFSYGSGSFEVANLLQFNKVEYLAVAFVDEGIDLRKAGIQLPIMVMGPTPSSFDALLAHQLEPEIYSFTMLTEFVGVLRKKGIDSYPIHLKVDTGMHRLGFSTTEVDALVNYLKETPVKVQSVFSHLAAAGTAEHDTFTEQQINSFVIFSQKLQRGLGYPVIRHIANTAGIQRWPQAHFEMVRLGIGLYGIGNENGRAGSLQQASSLKTTVIQLRKVPAGETVGYGRKGRIDKDSTIATVGIGYADGYDRRFGNGVGHMLIGNNPVATVGDVCMDMTMLDVTGIDVQEGDEVTVFGDVEALAKSIGTIPYELLTGISHRVKRVYFYG